jgi:hypothetical protein
MAGVEQLDRNRAIQPGVDRLVYLSHASRPEQGDYFVRSEVGPERERHDV